MALIIKIEKKVLSSEFRNWWLVEVLELILEKGNGSTHDLGHAQYYCTYSLHNKIGRLCSK